MANYTAGASLERKVRALFEEAGWECLRGAGSKGVVDGFKTDLVATKRSRTHKETIYMIALQCKRTKLRVRAKAGS